MAAAGRERGYAYLAITDHSASHGFGDHVTAERLWERIEEVAEWNKGKRGFRLLAGSEVNIGLDGSLDYPDDLVAALDWVVASVHTSFSISEAAMTERVLAAIENPHVDCIGHLTGRLIGRREPYGDRRRGGGRGGGRAPARCWRSTATPTAATSPSTTPAWPRRPARRSSSTPTPTASTRSTTWPTRSRPPAAPG